MGRSDRFLGTSLAIFALALALRALHLVSLRHSPFFEILMLDAAVYDAWARSLAAGDWLGSEVFYQAPLYPYFLGALYATLGDDLLVVRACQALLSSLACVFLADAGRHFFSRRAGVAAGVMLALYGPAIFLDGLVQKTVLDSFFLCAALALAGRANAGPRLRHGVAVGAALGLLALARENALVFAPVVLLWAALETRFTAARRARFAGAFLAAFIAVLAPVALRNLVVGGELHLTTSQFGPNFYIGNHEGARGTYRPLRGGRGEPRFERQDATELAEAALGRALTPAEVSRYWTGRAVDYITGQPGDWLGLMLRKATLLVNATELADAEDQYSYARWSWPLRLSSALIHFGVIVPLAVLGAFSSWSERRRLRLLYLMTVCYASSVLLFFIFARYRYPLVPLLVLFAGAAVAGLPAFLREAPRRRRLAGLLASVGVAVFCNWPLGYRDRMAATTHINLGHEFEKRGQREAAMREFRRALEFKPASVEAHNNLGSALLLEGELDAAIEHYRTAQRLAPRSEPVARNLERALAARQQRADTHSELAFALAAAGEPAKAAHHYAVALGEEEGAFRAGLALARELRSRGQPDAALAQLRQALEEKADSPPALRELALLLATHPDASRRDPAEAVALAERAAALTARQRPLVLEALAIAQASAGQPAQAAATLREALALAEGGRHALELRERLADYEEEATGTTR